MDDGSSVFVLRPSKRPYFIPKTEARRPKTPCQIPIRGAAPHLSQVSRAGRAFLDIRRVRESGAFRPTPAAAPPESRRARRASDRPRLTAPTGVRSGRGRAE